MLDKRMVPEIRFKGFDGEWEERRLGDFAISTFGGGTPATSINEYWDGDVPWIQSSDIAEEQLTNIIPRKRITQKGIKTSATKLVPKNSIAIVTRVGVGKLALLPFSYATSQDFLSLSNLKVDRWFGVYSIWKKIQGELHAVQGTSIKGITKEELLSKGMIVPMLELEQSHIGSFFQNLDSLITLHQRKYDKLTTVKKAMLEKMFPKDGADVPEIRFKGFTEKWERRTLGEIAEFAKGSGYSKKDLSEHGTPIILYGRLYTKYQVIIDDVDTFVIAKNGSVYSKGHEVIVPASGETAEDIARASAVVKAGILLGGDLNVVYPNENINPVFLALSISNGEQCKELSKKAKGKSVVHIHNSDLKEVSVLYPRVAEQSQIGSFFQNIDYLITLQQSEFDKLKNIKKACLEKMFV